MKIEGICGHSIDTSLLTEGGWVLDAGCRDFHFASAMVARGCNVVALDPDPEVEDPKIPGVFFLPLGLASNTGSDRLVLMENAEMRHLRKEAGYEKWETTNSVEVETVSIGELAGKFHVKRWDCVKLDIEGAEYEILKAWGGPKAKQITVEFHDHLEVRPPELYDQIYKHLGYWYAIAHQVPGDTLFVLQDKWLEQGGKP